MKGRRPRIYLLVILPLLILGGILVPYALVSALAGLKGMPVSMVSSPRALWVVIPGLLLWIPISLLLANFAINLIPPLRKTAQRYSTESGQPGFAQSQLRLFFVLLGTGVVCIPALAYGLMH